MQQTAASASSERPPIHLIDADYDLIAGLALSIERRSPELSKMLLDEIDRAEIYARDELPDDVVTIGSEVEFVETATGATRRVRLVLPAEADIENDRVSILTPIGAGLIGLRKGQSIDWPCPSGRPRVLQILNVTRPVAP
ncbi:nucleoside diphosphate kinase regulator [Sphingosinicella humi]|uniref:Nucleoside diphosphate kinase regulator n=1 Tax=Allosphingosinicella humi TaxID=2068657 RepID=A0A2U2J400_9SPHN|nr:nucleoside diphosphate kinase regulator [Sphingosinicella humi]PWG03048.1 nucleoside diphosphate kinase regulator [Sphingosinicella humi]